MLIETKLFLYSPEDSDKIVRKLIVKDSKTELRIEMSPVFKMQQKCQRRIACKMNPKKKSNFDKNFYVMNDVKRMQRMCYIKCAQQVVQNIFTSM